MTDDATDGPVADELAAISALGEPTRRAVYDTVVARGGWVSRDEAAEHTGLERATAAHHLDRLAADGLLDVEFRRLTERRGPGAGRPAKLYRRAAREFDVALPPRDYELAGRLLAEAADLSRAESIDISAAVDHVAGAEGRRLAERIDRRSHADGPGEHPGQALVDTLAEAGFEPLSDEGGTIVLRNCPFHHLARQHTDLICGMNLSLLTAAVGGDGAHDADDRSRRGDAASPGFVARLEPEQGYCCVRLHPR